MPANLPGSRAYHQQRIALGVPEGADFGFEKTFFGGNASLGLRVPVDTLTADSTVRGLGGTSTSFGNLTAFAKLILAKVKSSPGAYKVDTEDLLSLKRAGVSDTVIAAMVSAQKN